MHSVTFSKPGVTSSNLHDMQLFKANGYYFIFTMKLQSNEKTLIPLVQGLTNLYKQKDLKLNLSRVSGVKTLFKIAIW
jgi:hypothetical protein